MIKFNYALDNYSASKALLWGNCKSHWDKSETGDLKGRKIHRLIAIIEAIPIIGQIASLFEFAIVAIGKRYSLLQASEIHEIMEKPTTENLPVILTGYGDWEENPVLKAALEQHYANKIQYIGTSDYESIKPLNYHHNHVIALIKAANIQTATRISFYGDARTGFPLLEFDRKMKDHYLVIIDLSNQKDPSKIDFEAVFNYFDKDRKLETLHRENRLFLWRPDDSVESLVADVLKKTNNLI